MNIAEVLTELHRRLTERGYRVVRERHHLVAEVEGPGRFALTPDWSAFGDSEIENVDLDDIVDFYAEILDGYGKGTLFTGAQVLERVRQARGGREIVLLFQGGNIQDLPGPFDQAAIDACIRDTESYQ
jgi:hypothetical protein